jgi:hypothetical protein
VAIGLSLKRTQKGTALKKEHPAKDYQKLETKIHKLTKMSGKTILKIQTSLSTPPSKLTIEPSGSTVFLGTKRLTLQIKRFSDLVSSERISAR